MEDETGKGKVKAMAADQVVRVIEYDEECIPAPQLAITEERRRYCPHEHINIYQYHRKIHCKDCGAALEAFDWILGMGMHERNQLSTLYWLNRQVKERKLEIEQLEKAVKNLKAQKRRL